MKNYVQKNSILLMLIIVIIFKRKKLYINKKLNMLPIHKELSKKDVSKTQMDFDATSLYPSAM